MVTKDRDLKIENMPTDDSPMDASNISRSDSADQSESTDVSDYATDFASQLRKQRKQVLEKEVASKNNFAESLRKHRDHLVDAWVETNQGLTKGDADVDHGMNGKFAEATTTDQCEDDSEATTSEANGRANAQADALPSEFENDVFFQETVARNDSQVQDPASSEERLADNSTQQLEDSEPFDDSMETSNVENDDTTLNAVNLQTLTNEVINNETHDDDDFFGDFEAPIDSQTGNSKEDSKSDDLDQAPVSNENTSEMATPVENQDDFFGAFDTAESSTPPGTGNMDTEASATDESETALVSSEVGTQDRPCNTGKATPSPLVETKKDVGGNDPVAFETLSQSQEVCGDNMNNDTISNTVLTDTSDGGASSEAPQLSINEAVSDDDFDGKTSAKLEQDAQEDTLLSRGIDNSSESHVFEHESDTETKEGFTMVDEDLPYSQDDHNLGRFDKPYVDVAHDDTNNVDVSWQQVQSDVSRSGEITDTGDDYGDFDGASPESTLGNGEERGNNDIIVNPPSEERPEVQATFNDDDGFGKFDEGASIPSNTKNEGAFGEFEAVQPVPLETVHGVFDDGNRTPLKTGNNMDGIDGDGFGNLSGISSPHEHTSDDFGDLSTVAPAPPTNPHQPEKSRQDDDINFGDFDSAPSLSADDDTGDQILEADDDFGDFGEANNVVDNDAKDEDKEVIDDFGDFGEACNADNGTKEEAQEADDDFGDFGETHIVVDNGANDEDKEAINDFEDFGEARSSGNGTMEETQKADGDLGDFNATDVGAETNKGDKTQAELDDDDDDFGDFDAAPTVNAETNEEEKAEDDDFGDFDAAPSAKAEGGDFMDTQADDDFGDFGDFDTAPSPVVDPDHNDDFGEFDAAPPTKVDINEQETQQCDNDDEFGGFDVAPSRKEALIDAADDFGNFDDVAAQSISPLAPVGEITDKARAFFVDVQSKYPFPEVDDHVEEKDQATMDRSLSEIVSSLSMQRKDVTQVFSNTMLQVAIRSPQPREEKSRIIIEGDGHGPSEPFVYPVGGLHAPDKEFRMERDRRSLRTKVPDVLPIQLPTGTDEAPLNAASPVSRKQSAHRSSIDVPSLPNLSNVSTAVESNVEKLMARIPDLSFMLQSTLVLPNKATT
jgi:hypothetical protein